MGEEQDDEETWGLEGGYSFDRGLSRHSLDFSSGKREDEEEGEDSDGGNKRSPPLFAEAKGGGEQNEQ